MSPIEPQDLSRQHAQLRRLARAIVGESYADDVVQDAWAAALAHPGPPPRSWGAWLNRVTRSLAWKRRVKDERAKAREIDRTGLGVARSSDMESPEALIAEVEEKHALERELLEMEEPYRSALLWRFYGGLSVDEVAERVGQNPSTTRTQIKRGLERLRRRLEKKNGADWRAALVPLVGRGLDGGGGLPPLESTTPGAHVAAGSTVALKVVIALAGAWALLVGGRAFMQGLQPGAVSEVGLVKPAAPAESDVGAVPVSVVLEAVEEEPVRAEVAAPPQEQPAMAPAAPVKAATAPEPETTILLTEAASGEPLAGVSIEVTYAYMKRRALFFKSTEFAKTVVSTDAEGRAVLPVETDADGWAAGNQLRGVLATGSLPGAVVYVQAVPGKTRGVVELQLRNAMAFRVQLPVALTDVERDALTATLATLEAGRFQSVDMRVFEPVAVDGRELTFAIDQRGAGGRFQGGTLHIATSPLGRTFHAEVPPDATLATPALQAVAASDVTHSFRLLDGAGAPMPGEIVYVGRPTVGQPYACRDAMGRTSSEGVATLTGIAPGEVTVWVRAEGYEEYREKIEPLAGATTELRLVRKSGLRTVALTVVGEGPGVPDFVDVRVTAGIDRPEKVTSLMLQPEPVRGGWTVAASLENVPGEVCFMEVSTIPREYDRVAPVRIVPEKESLRVSMGEAHRLTKVRLRLPPLVEVEYGQMAGDGRMYSMRGPHVDGSVTGWVEDDGRPVIWTVTAPGYVPVLGSQADWRRVKEGDVEYIEITPELRRGWGALIDVQSREWDRSVPFHLSKERPMAGVSIFDVATGKTLGVTDASGYAVITAAHPVQEIGAHYGDKTRTWPLRGATRFGFGF